MEISAKESMRQIVGRLNDALKSELKRKIGSKERNYLDRVATLKNTITGRKSIKNYYHPKCSQFIDSYHSEIVKSDDFCDYVYYNIDDFIENIELISQTIEKSRRGDEDFAGDINQIVGSIAYIYRQTFKQNVYVGSASNRALQHDPLAKPNSPFAIFCDEILRYLDVKSSRGEPYGRDAIKQASRDSINGSYKPSKPEPELVAARNELAPRKRGRPRKKV
ncbi:MAG: hypothetical protein ACKVON_06525 [Beijerinckiaceae bacterium]